MTAVTVQLDENLLERSRAVAQERNATLDEVVADALRSNVETAIDSTQEHPFLRALREIGLRDTGGPYTRDELNER